MPTSTTSDAIYSPDGEVLLSCSKDFQGTFIVPNGVTTIKQFAFKDCDGVKKVVLSDSVRTIQDHGFAYCRNVEEIQLSKNTQNIFMDAFRNCASLKRIEIPAGIKHLQLHTFAYCTGLEEITIPDGVETIADFAFSNCNSLRHLFIPASVKVVGTKIAECCEPYPDLKFYCEGEIGEKWDAAWNKVRMSAKTKMAETHENVPRWWYEKFIEQNI